MFTSRPIIVAVALFVIAIGSSLVLVSSFVGPTFAGNKNKGSDNQMANFGGTSKSSSSTSQSISSSRGSSGSTGNSNSISADLSSLSGCQSGAAGDGVLTQAEVDDCYSQIFG